MYEYHPSLPRIPLTGYEVPPLHPRQEPVHRGRHQNALFAGSILAGVTSVASTAANVLTSYETGALAWGAAAVTVVVAGAMAIQDMVQKREQPVVQLPECLGTLPTVDQLPPNNSGSWPDPR